MEFGFNDKDDVYCNVSGSATHIDYRQDGPNVSGQTATVYINFYDPKNKK